MILFILWREVQSKILMNNCERIIWKKDNQWTGFWWFQGQVDDIKRKK